MPPDGTARFAARHPVVWHVVEAEGLPGLLRHGLLPAAELRRQAGTLGTGANREDYQPLVLPGGATALLRFQQMADDKLMPSLTGRFAGQPALWRGHIDGHVFFWADAARRDSFIRANTRERARSRAAPSASPAAVLAYDTATLLAHAGPAAFYSTFNTGSTVRGAARAQRDENTFHPIAEYRSGPTAELAIRGAVPPDVLTAQPSWTLP